MILVAEFISPKMMSLMKSSSLILCFTLNLLSHPNILQQPLLNPFISYQRHLPIQHLDMTSIPFPIVLTLTIFQATHLALQFRPPMTPRLCQFIPQPLLQTTSHNPLLVLLLTFPIQLFLYLPIQMTSLMSAHPLLTMLLAPTTSILQIYLH